MKLKFYKSIFKGISFLFFISNSLLLHAQWNSKIPQTNDTIWVLYNQVIDLNTVWMGGNQYVYDSTNKLKLGNFVSIYNTSDGGVNWKYKRFDIDPSTGPFLTTISGINGLKGWAGIYQLNLGSNIILKTNDGGTTWSPTATNTYLNGASYLDGISFKDALNGIMIGDPSPDTDSTDAYFEIYSTLDGGATWLKVPQSQMPDPLADEYGISGEYSRINDNIWFATDHGRVFNSNDGGQHWKVNVVGTGYTGYLNFVDNLHGICASMDSAYPETFLDIKYSEDGGLHWQHVESPFKDSTFLWSVCLIPGSNYILINHAATNQGAPFKTFLSKDKGQTWVEIGNNDGLSNAQFINPKVGYAGEGISLNQDHATKIFKYAGDPLTGLLTSTTLKAEISIYPNPVLEKISMNIKLEQPSSLLILLNSSEGKLVWNKKWSGVSDTYYEEYDATDLSPGSYTLTFSSPNGNISRTIVKR